MSVVQDQQLASLQARVEELEATLAYALAQLDGVTALQASLGELERRLELNEAFNKGRPKPRRPRIRRRLALLVLSVLSLLSGLAVLARRVFLQAQTPTASGAVTPGKQPQPGANLTLITQGDTWLEAQASNGKVLHYGLLKPGRYQLPFQQPLRLRAGRPDLVTVNYAGTSRKLGPINATGWHVFKPQKLR